MTPRAAILVALLGGCAAELGPTATSDSAAPGDSDAGWSGPGWGGPAAAHDTDGGVDSAPGARPEDAPGVDTTPPPVEALRFDGPRPRDVLMISIDTFRPDFMGRYTGDADDSPALDALLEGGVVLENHRGCSNWTLAAVACAQSGMRPTQSGFVALPGSLDPVPESVRLASEVMRDAGYQTALVSGNTVFSATTALDRGFDSSVHLQVEADGITNEIRAVFEGLDPAQPWYVHAHFFDPHTPYVPPEEFLGDTSHLPPIPYDLSDREAYGAIHQDWPGLGAQERAAVVEHFVHYSRAEVRHMDHRIDQLLEELEAGGWLEEALIVLWSDHGEQFGEHGELGHGLSLYLDEVDAIAAFHAPGLAPAVWTGSTEHVDIWPTILDALALDIDAPFLGAPVGARLHYDWGGALRLYRLDDDPGEQRDVLDPDDPEAAALWELLLPEIEALHGIMEEGRPIDPGVW